jgi:ankyrin repeat protein
MIHLVRGGANVNAFDMDGWTALHYAAYYDHYSVLLLLLDAGANTFAVDVDLNWPVNHVRDNSPLLTTITKNMRSQKERDS